VRGTSWCAGTIQNVRLNGKTPIDRCCELFSEPPLSEEVDSSYDTLKGQMRVADYGLDISLAELRLSLLITHLHMCRNVQGASCQDWHSYLNFLFNLFRSKPTALRIEVTESLLKSRISKIKKSPLAFFPIVVVHPHPFLLYLSNVLHS